MTSPPLNVFVQAHERVGLACWRVRACARAFAGRGRAFMHMTPHVVRLPRFLAIRRPQQRQGRAFNVDLGIASVPRGARFVQRFVEGFGKRFARRTGPAGGLISKGLRRGFVPRDRPGTGQGRDRDAHRALPVAGESLPGSASGRKWPPWI